MRIVDGLPCIDVDGDLDFFTLTFRRNPISVPYQISHSWLISTPSHLNMGKKRAREADGAPPADNSVDKMDEDSSDEEVSAVGSRIHALLD